MRTNSLRARRAFRLNPIACALTLLPAALGAQTLPGGVSVVRGQAAVNTVGNRMTVTNSNGAILNWQQFSIGAQKAVRFEQPNAASQVLNRVTGNNPSQILGSLSSNGKVWLLNPNGVLFGQGARVDVAGLVASTLSVNDRDWLAGRFNFSRSAGAAGDGRVVNHGELRTVAGGQVMLLGSSVSNEGLIDAPGGQVVLAAGKSIDLSDTHLPSFAVRITAPDGAAVNVGQVLAPGGRIDLAAAMVNQQGVLRADAIGHGPAGEVRLQASSSVDLAAGSITGASGRAGGRITVDSGGGTTLVAGDVTAAGSVDRGGAVKLLGRRVGVLDAGVVDVSGAAGGGDIFVGGGAQGRDANMPNAEAAYIAPAARLTADATGSGDGGRVIVWSDLATRAYGNFSARGGPEGGNGGLIETSGGWLDARPSSIATQAPRGLQGAWLLDPNNIEIRNGDGAIGIDSVNAASGTFFRTRDDAAVIGTNVIGRVLNAGTNVWIETASGGRNSEAGNITMDSATIKVTPRRPVTLTLLGAGTVAIKGSEVTTDGAGLSLSLSAPSVAITNSTVETGAGNLTIRDRVGTVDLTSASITAQDILLGATSRITASGSTLNANGDIRLAAPSVTSSSAIVAQGALQVLTDSLVTRPGPAGSTPRLEANGPRNALIIAGFSGSSSAGRNMKQLDDSAASLRLVTPQGRWLLYAIDPGGMTRARDLGNDATVYNTTYPSPVDPTITAQHPSTAGQNLLLFSSSPTLTRGDSTPVPLVKTYDGDTFITLPVGLLNGTLPGDRLVGRFSDENAGAGKRVELFGRGNHAEGVDASGKPVYGYRLRDNPFTLSGDINPASVTLSTVFADKTYDGLTAAQLASFGLSGPVGSEQLAVSVDRLAFNTKDAGIAKPVSGIATLRDGANGGLASNYSLSNPTVSGTASISRRPVTLSPVFADKTYDGFTVAQLLGVGWSGLVGSEQLGVSVDRVAFNTKDAGIAKPVSGFATLTNGPNGGLASNYILSNPTVSGIASISRRPVTVSPVFANKTYDGLTTAQLASFGLSGLVGSEQLAVSAAALAFDTKDAGVAKPVSGPATLLDGANGGLASNYILSNPNLTGNASISRQPVTLSPVVADKTYDGSTVAQLASFSLSGLVGNEQLAVLADTLAFNNKDAGIAKPVSGPATLLDGGNGGLASNYILSNPNLTGSATISRRPVALSSVFADKTYDGSTVAQLASFGLSGLVGSEQLAVSADTLAFNTKDAGTAKPVSGPATLLDGANGGLASNYILSNPNVSGTASISRRPVTVSPVFADKTYDGSTVAQLASFGLSGLVGSEQLAVSGFTFNTKDAGVAKPVSGPATLLNGANGGLASNYILSNPSVSGNASILRRPVTVSPVFADKTYDGLTTAQLASFGLSGLVGSEQLAVSADTLAFNTRDAGVAKPVSGPATLLDGANGGLASNYSLSNPELTGTASISARPVTLVSVSVADKVYDGTQTATVNGFALDRIVAGDAVMANPGPATFDTADVGNAKPVTVATGVLSGADSGNYQLAGAFATARASVTPATLTYVATPATMFAGAPLPPLGGEVIGFVPGETAASATRGSLQFTPATPPSSPGLYAVHGSGLAASNYQFVQARDNETALHVEPPLQGVVQDAPKELFSAVQTLKLPLGFTSPAIGRVLDGLAAVRPGTSSLAFQQVPVGSMTQEALEAMLAARELLKRNLFAQSIHRLEQDPALADVPPCRTIDQIETGQCLMAPALNVGRPPPSPTADVPPATPPAGTMAPQAPAAMDPAAVPSSPPPAAGPPAGAATPSTPAAGSTTPSTLLFPKRSIRSAALPQIERKLAVLIGNDRYADARIPQLDNAVADVRAVAAILESALGYETVVIENAGKARMVATLNKLAAEASGSDSVVVYYAGHGQLVPSTGLGYWQPADADADKPESWISNGDIGKLIEQIGASQVALISDSCYSGSLVAEERIRATAAALDPAQVLQTKAAVVMSSGGNEPVFDSGKDGHSVFSWNLMRTLQQVPTWQAGGNVFERVRFAVARELPQRPRYGAAPQWGHQAGSDYLFEKRELGAAQ